MKKLFSDFKPADYETWINQIKKDLKDKPLEALESNPEKDLSIRAYYHPKKDQFSSDQNTFANNFQRPSNNWFIRKEYSAGSNAEILKDLENGVDAVSLEAVSEDQLQKDQNGILFQYILSDVRFTEKKLACHAKVAKETILNFDVIALNASAGKNQFTLNDFFDFFQNRKDQKCIWVNGFLYGESGSSTVQELAFTLSHLNEYLQTLHDQKADLKQAAKQVAIQLSVNENYFVNLAKFRAIRELTALLFSAYDIHLAGTEITFLAKTSSRSLTINDSNTNFLRQTTQAMSAVLGGCEALTIQPLKSEDEKQISLADRMTRNIQLVLREESYLDKVIDPSAGSMYIENLTDQLIEKAWILFREIENKGGHLKSLQSNFIQNLIQENRTYLTEKIQSKKQTLLGVNKYPSSLESWKEIPQPGSALKVDFLALAPFNLEAIYQPNPVVS